MIKNKAMVYLNGEILLLMKVNFRMIIDMAMEYVNGKMALFTKDNGFKESNQKNTYKYNNHRCQLRDELF